VSADSKVRQKSGAGLYLGMLWAVFLLIGGVSFGAIALFEPFLSDAASGLPLTGYFMVIFVMALLAAGILSSMAGDQTPSRLSRLLQKAVMRMMMPLAFFLGRVLGISKDALWLSFVKSNNQQVLSRRFRLKPEQLLVLLPQCLQGKDCDRRLTNDIGNCQLCGKCDIAALVKLFAEYGLSASVVPGGTLARSLVETRSPKAIIAIACERELSSGIVDTYPIPVISVVNERPNGPCIETRVSINAVDRAIRRSLGLGSRPDVQGCGIEHKDERKQTPGLQWGS